uniref:ubiquitin carboxyl-terminal hydrolase 5-like n=1 Tax=Pristiophorus japonicus TaxID=55135 RepID=UPI00398EA554
MGGERTLIGWLARALRRLLPLAPRAGERFSFFFPRWCIMAEFGDLLLSVLASVRVPRSGDRVHKDECAFSFDSPESEGGLYICMNTFLGFGKQFVQKHYQKTGQRAYLHLRRTRLPKVDDGSSGAGDPPKKKPTRLAIGVEGGFDVDTENFEYDEEVKVVILPENAVIPRDALSLMPAAVRDRVRIPSNCTRITHCPGILTVYPHFISSVSIERSRG